MLFILLSFSLCVLACGGRGCPTLLLENTTKRKACIWAWSFSWVELVSGLRGNISCMKCSHFDIWICLCFLPISRFFILCFREIWTHQRLSLWLRNSRWMDDIWETFGDCYTFHIQSYGCLQWNWSIALNLFIYLLKLLDHLYIFHPGVVAGDNDGTETWFPLETKIMPSRCLFILLNFSFTNTSPKWKNSNRQSG